MKKVCHSGVWKIQKKFVSLEFAFNQITHGRLHIDQTQLIILYMMV